MARERPTSAVRSHERGTCGHPRTMGSIPSKPSSQENMSAHRPSRAKTLVLLLETSEVCRACSLLCTTAVCLETAVAAVMTSASVSDSCLPCWRDLLVVPSTSLFTRTAQHPGQARNTGPHRSNYILWQRGCAHSMQDLVQGAWEGGGGGLGWWGGHCAGFRSALYSAVLSTTAAR